jgi:hypothetical protein
MKLTVESAFDVALNQCCLPHKSGSVFQHNGIDRYVIEMMNVTFH